MAGRAYFQNASFKFLKELKENESSYEGDIKDPALSLPEDFGPYLNKMRPHFMATMRSPFRFYRNTRFRKNKTHYTTASEEISSVSSPGPRSWRHPKIFQRNSPTVSKQVSRSCPSFTRRSTSHSSPLT